MKIIKTALSAPLFGLAAMSVTSNANAQNAVVFQPVERTNEHTVCVNLETNQLLKENQLRQWILGFWSGINVGSGIQGGAFDTGHSLTSDGIIGEIKLYCKQHPSTELTRATIDVFKNMNALRK